MKRPETVGVQKPPRNRIAEVALLGGLFVAGTIPDDVTEFISGPEDWPDRRDQYVYRAMVYCHKRGQRIEMASVAAVLRERNLLAGAGGNVYLSSLITETPTDARLAFHAEIVRDRSLKLRIWKALVSAANLVATDIEDCDECVAEVERRVIEATQARHRDTATTEHVGSISQRVMAQCHERREHRGSLSGITTGFRDLDDLTGGLQDSDLIVVAGRPSVGKTTLALEFARAAAETEKKALVISLEMGRDQLVMRLLCSIGGVDSRRARQGTVSLDDLERLTVADRHLDSLPLFINDMSAATLGEVTADCRKMIVDAGGIDIVLVDYISLMSSPRHGKGGTREREVAEFSGGLKALAKKLDIPVVVLSQLNRDLEKRVDKRPTMADLRESGAVEQDADVIMFVYRDEVYNKETHDAGTAEIIISKQRNGPIGTVRLGFDPATTSFSELYGGSSQGQIGD